MIQCPLPSYSNLPHPPNPDVYLPPSGLTAGYWWWALIGILVVGWEIFAWRTKKVPTLTNTVRKGAKWFKWFIGVGLTVLMWHLFLAKERFKQWTNGL